MKALVRVEDDWMRDGVALHIAERGETHLHILDFAGLIAHTQERAVASQEPQAAYEPLRLKQDMARALYEGLAAYFGGHPETASLRKDYEAERARVDTFIAYMTEASA